MIHYMVVYVEYIWIKTLSLVNPDVSGAHSLFTIQVVHVYDIKLQSRRRNARSDATILQLLQGGSTLSDPQVVVTVGNV